MPSTAVTSHGSWWGVRSRRLADDPASRLIMERTKTLPALLAVFAALTYACSTVLTRVVGLHDPPWTITLYSMGAFLVGSVIASACVAAPPRST